MANWLRIGRQPGDFVLHQSDNRETKTQTMQEWSMEFAYID